MSNVTGNTAIVTSLLTGGKISSLWHPYNLQNNSFFLIQSICYSLVEGNIPTQQ